MLAIAQGENIVRAIRDGYVKHTECLIFLHKQGADIHPSCASHAVENKDIKSLMYLTKHHLLSNEPSHSPYELAIYAAHHGHLQCLKYLMRQIKILF